MANKLISPGNSNNNYLNIAFDLILKLGSLFLLIFLCFKIIRPFLGILLWGMIISIILFPLFHKMYHWLGKRNKLTSFVITIVALSLLVFPSIWLVNQLVDGIKYLTGDVQVGNLTIPPPKLPPPSESVANWPLIGPWIYENWSNMSENLGESLKGFMPHFKDLSEKVLAAFANTGLGILQFAISIIIAGIFLIFFENGSESGRRVFKKVVGERGEEFLHVTLATIRSVATGVLGVAVIQATLIGLGMVLADVPFAAIWIIVVLIMAIAQMPVLLFNIFLIIYLFAFLEPLPAVLWTIYFLVMGALDNVLKPIIMGKASDVPSLVIFIGTIGGFAAFGFVGLFLGAILLSIAYKLYVTWISDANSLSQPGNSL